MTIRATFMDETPRFACLKCGIVFEHPETGKRVKCPKVEGHYTIRVSSEKDWNKRLTQHLSFLVLFPMLIGFAMVVAIFAVPPPVLVLFLLLIPFYLIGFSDFYTIKKAYRLAWGREFTEDFPMAKRIVNYPDSNASLESLSAPRPARPGPRPP